jgi:tricorn protease
VADKSKRLIADEKRGQLRTMSGPPAPGTSPFSLTGETPYPRHPHLERNRRAGPARHRPDVPAGNPAWDPEGNYLFYLSDREFHPLIGNNEFNFALTRSTQIYALALKKDAKHPFPPESDEVTDHRGKETRGKEAGREKARGKEGRKRRSTTTASPCAPPACRWLPANYGGLFANKGHLIYSRGGDFFYGRRSGGNPALVIFSMKDRKETVLAGQPPGFAISGDGSKLLVRAQGSSSS